MLYKKKKLNKLKKKLTLGYEAQQLWIAVPNEYSENCLHGLKRGISEGWILSKTKLLFIPAENRPAKILWLDSLISPTQKAKNLDVRLNNIYLHPTNKPHYC